MAIVGFPLLLIPLAICNILVFLMPGVAFTAPLATLTLPSGAAWTFTVSDVLLSLGALLLLLEVIKGARPGAKYVTDHLLSLLVFACAAAEFILLPPFGNSTFFVLALLALVDVLAGIALHRRPQPRVARKAPTAPAKAPPPQQPEQASPPPELPAATLVAETVLLDRPEPVAVTTPAAAPQAEPANMPTPDPEPDAESPAPRR
ncbi:MULTISPECIES: hypothetical protein [Rhodopseudomonas]|uniref:Uncharacterized protein n=1 Tax=Rhodopseudomonas palustris TaxID=1076 RepID=A0A0D7EKF5_RHOPL|nr:MULTISPECIES: hypothetical protein [Rhodopseudomonas]KIZ41131.1 hypothetical protein OO17_15895 [Rhodopseudomonas palustris]MDF3810526.1 hypothetical protein [Rhodopseudomonas sp. BAL398]WOK16588.1 hypothetical protein RBJ75_20905 [Rhodopseudomonas sp. BAL398]